MQSSLSQADKVFGVAWTPRIRQLRMIVLVQGLSMHMTRINLIARKPERPSVRPYALQDIKERQFG